MNLHCACALPYTAEFIYLFICDAVYICLCGAIYVQGYAPWDASDDMYNMYNSTVSRYNSSSSSEVKQVIVCSVGPYDLTLADFATLRQGEWVNDNIVNAVGGVLQRFNHRLAGQQQAPQVHICSSFFMEKLHLAPGNLGHTNFAAVQRWTLPTALARRQQPHPLDCRYLMVPCHLPGHWVLAVADRQHRTIIYIDPMQVCPSALLHAMMQLLPACVNCRTLLAAG